MRKILMPLFLTVPFILFAQAPRFSPDDKLTDEQRSVLQAKTMKLQLDLTDAQEQQLQTVFFDHFQSKPKRPQNPRALSQDARYTLRMEQLTHMESLQENLKKVLSESQYTAFREKQKDTRMAIKKRLANREHRPMRHRRY